MNDKEKFESLKKRETELSGNLVKINTMKEGLDAEITEIEKNLKTEHKLSSVTDIQNAITKIKSEMDSKAQIILENINNFYSVYTGIPDDQKPKFAEVLATVKAVEADIKGVQV